MDKSGSYFTITDLANALDVKKSHIRYCEKNGLIAPRATHLKRRVYSRYDRERLRLIFRFVLLGYSKEQITEMIGKPEKNLSENDQMFQGIAYGEARIETLETEKDHSSFSKRSRIVNEIEMLREYIKNVRAIKAGIDEKSSEKNGNKSHGDAERFYPEKQHPVKVISVFITGVVLVTVIGSYFYYRTGNEAPKSVKQVQKKVVPKEPILIDQATEPPVQKSNPPSVVPQIPKKPELPSETQAGTLMPRPDESAAEAPQAGTLMPKPDESAAEAPRTGTLEPAAGDVRVTPDNSLPGPSEKLVPTKTDAEKEEPAQGMQEKPNPAPAEQGALPPDKPELLKEKSNPIPQGEKQKVDPENLLEGETQK